MSEEIRNKQEHNHCHSHEHHHDHIHDHHHDHHHDHNQHHHNDQNEDSKELALLKYMVEHNAHHAEEIANMAKMLREAGQITAADELANGVSDFETGTAHLSKAYDILKGEI